MHLVGEFDADYTFIDNDGPVFWFRTDKNAPRGRVSRSTPESPRQADWVDVIPEQSETLEGVDVVGGCFLARYLKDAHSVVRVFDMAGRHLRDVDFPGWGPPRVSRARRSDKETFYGFTSFTTPDYDLSVRCRRRDEQALAQPQAQFRPEGL